MQNEGSKGASHTPGPWVLDPEPHSDAGFYIQANVPANDDPDAGMCVTEVNQPSHGRIGWAEHCANARLIAAAPELLTLALHVANATDEDWTRPSFIEAVRSAGRNLSAKAEGR
jgi:hypothetical protein